MPFFCTILKSKNQSVTLQVRILNIKKFLGRKRVSFSASASLTLEAALVLPLFIFAGVIMMMPFRIMDIQRQVQASAEQVCEEISQTAYLSKYTVPSDYTASFETKTAYGEMNEFWNGAAAYAYAELKMRTKLQDLPVTQLSFLRSSLLEDGETVDLVVDYKIQIPFSVLGIKDMKQTCRSCRRAWVGENGRSREKTDEELEDTIVYIGKNSTRYHVSNTCHYLHNNLEAVSAGEVGNRRNQEGSRYSPCARCSTQNRESVYIVPSGRHYHGTPLCPAINAYVTAVPKSEVEYLGACSYCSKEQPKN